MSAQPFAVRSLAALAATMLLLPSARGGQGEVSYEFFYAALQASGMWMESVEFGYVWQPRIATDSADWRPYTDGYWSHTDQGWTWVSYEDFGWATYHYGRWAHLAETGWIWIPGFQWAPAWVAWRASPTLTGRPLPPAPRPDLSAVSVEAEDVVGWAPLPPEAKFEISRGINAQADLEFGLGPDLYNFVSVRNFGESVIKPWVMRQTSNADLFGSTWNCTNLAYRANPGFIWSGGPIYLSVRPYTENSIAQLNLESHYVSARTPLGEVWNHVEGDQFIVVAPAVKPPAGQSAASIGLPVGPATARPPQLGPEIPERVVDRGWSAIESDPAVLAGLRDQIKRDASAATAAAAITPTGGKSPTVILAASPTSDGARQPDEKSRKSRPRDGTPAPDRD